MAGIGDPLPALDHAVSVSLPSWNSTVGYEEGAEWVSTKMRNGYPRFFVNFEIRNLADSIVNRYGKDGQTALLFSSLTIARQCIRFIERRTNATKSEYASLLHKHQYDEVLELYVRGPTSEHERDNMMVFAVMLSKSSYDVALKFWQHTGEGISSRRARFLQEALDHGRVEQLSEPGLANGNGHTNDGKSFNGYGRFRSSRNRIQDLLAVEAKSLIKSRLAGNLDAYEGDDLIVPGHTSSAGGIRKISEQDVFLFPTGMSAMFNIHQFLMKARGSLRSVMFGFPYTDTLKILENFGPGCLFYGHSSKEELDELEARCEQGEKFLALFCEVPGNPLLGTPDLHRIKQLAHRFDFAVVVDDTVGNFLNVNVLPVADAVVSSLTKVFSGASNVMGGSCVLNSQGRYYEQLLRVLAVEYRDHYWSDDAVVMEQNSRDFVVRNRLINENTQKICDRLRASPLIKDIFYPSLRPTKAYYDAYRTSDGGYGGLFSLTFHDDEDARCFFDALAVAKGPSLGTNFTIASPYVILAHYHELEWAASYGVPAALVRASVGTEDYSLVLAAFEAALQSLHERHSS